MTNPTPDEMTFSAYSDCYKSDYGVRPSLVSADEAQAWLDARAAKIADNEANGRPTFWGIGLDYGHDEDVIADEEYRARYLAGEFNGDEDAAPDLNTLNFADWMEVRARQQGLID